MKEPTQNQALNRVLNELTSTLHDVLKGNLVGVYLQGSLAIGDFDEWSDVDYIAVIDQELTDENLLSLEQEMVRIQGGQVRFGSNLRIQTHPENESHWRSSLEGSFFPKDQLLQLIPGSPELWYFDNGSTKLQRSHHDDTWVVRWTLRERGLCLYGPPPKQLVLPIQAEALRSEVIATMQVITDAFQAEYGQDGLGFFHSEFGQAFTVLSICRILQTIKTAEVHSKAEGVRWAKANLNGIWAGLISEAWERRKGAHVKRKIDQEAILQTSKFIKMALEKARYS